VTEKEKIWNWLKENVCEQEFDEKKTEIVKIIVNHTWLMCELYHRVDENNDK
jgi:hypothetical protein